MKPSKRKWDFWMTIPFQEKEKMQHRGYLPSHPPFNYDSYTKALEKAATEKDSKSKSENDENSFWAWLINLPLSALSLIIGEDAVNGMNPGTEISEDPLNEELWKNGTMNDYNN